MGLASEENIEIKWEPTSAFLPMQQAFAVLDALYCTAWNNQPIACSWQNLWVLVGSCRVLLKADRSVLLTIFRDAFNITLFNV